MFCKFKNRLKISSAKSHQFGFFKIRKHWISLTKKNVMGLKFCMEVDISSADENLIKRIKKVWGKKRSCRGSNPDLNETNGYFQIS